MRHRSATPYWLRNVVDRFWIAAGELEPFPRKLEGPVAWALPLAIFKVPRLCVQDVERRLSDFGVQFRIANQDRVLHGCLVAFGGKGIVFLDGSDPDDELRFSLAHEIGHFLVDYVWPRDRAIKRLGPAIAEVLDGRRLPTVAERIDAVLGDAPIGVHTHLMDRLPSGQIGCGHIAGAEHRADRLALELLAPEADVRAALLPLAGAPEEDRAGQLERLLKERFGLPRNVAREYARFLIGVGQRPPTVRDWLGIDRGQRERLPG
jgi:hypothetical protein